MSASPHTSEYSEYIAEYHTDARGVQYELRRRFTEGDITLISDGCAFQTRKALLAAVRYAHMQPLRLSHVLNV